MSFDPFRTGEPRSAGGGSHRSTSEFASTNQRPAVRGGCVFSTRPPRSWAVSTRGDRPMIAFAKQKKDSSSSWQDSFLAMLPEIKSRLRNEFRELNGDAREEAICEGVAHC